MKAIIPAAGRGTGMSPFSAAAGKELAPIGVWPAIQWVLAEAAAAGVSEAAVVISPEKDALESFLRGRFDPAYRKKEAMRTWLGILERLRIEVVEQPEPVGLGDALLRGRAVLGDGPVYLLYPDNLLGAGTRLLKTLERLHADSGLCVVACKREKPFLLGNNYVVVSERVGGAYRVTEFTAKDGPRPKGTFFRAAGRALVTDEFFDGLRAAAPSAQGRELDDIDSYNPLAREGRLLCLPPDEEFFDAGSLDGYSEAWQGFLSGALKPFDSAE